jgi:hypothetical protein
VTTAKRKPRPKPGELEKAKVAARRQSDAARAAIPSPRPGTHAHKMWRMLGLPDRPPQPLPRTKEEARYQMVTPGARASTAAKASIKAEHEWWKGHRRGAGRLKGDDSKETRAKYAGVIAAFIRDGEDALLIGTIRKTKIREFVTDSPAMPALLEEPLKLGDDPDDNDDALNRFATAFIKFLQLNQSWVREQISLASAR